jgi:hypothetical protein
MRRPIHSWKDTLDRLGLVFKKVTHAKPAKLPPRAVPLGFEHLEPRAMLAVISISANVSSLSEGAAAESFIVSRDDTSGSLVVGFGISGAAANGVDYGTLSDSVTIPDGASQATVTLAPIDDGDSEANEDVTLTLQGGSSSGSFTISSHASQATITILTTMVAAVAAAVPP